MTWFHPGVSVQRADVADPARGGRPAATSPAGRDAEIIQPGDLVWVDFGISYLGLQTDTQQLAYVLRAGETSAPAGLVAGMAAANRVQDHLTDAFATGRTGNEILAAALARSTADGLDATIYTHPIGFHGHGAGPTIGLWDQQGGVPGPRRLSALPEHGALDRAERRRGGPRVGRQADPVQPGGGRHLRRRDGPLHRPAPDRAAADPAPEVAASSPARQACTASGWRWAPSWHL